MECKTLEELLATTEPAEEYLANAGCLRPMRKKDKNLLVDDILVFQVVHRVHGPYDRYVLINPIFYASSEAFYRVGMASFYEHTGRGNA